MAITATNIKIHSAGDQKKITADLANITDSDTWVCPHLRVAEDWSFTLTTEEDHGITGSGATLTFRSSSTIAGKVTVYGR